MCRVTLSSPTIKAELDVTPTADFITCLIPALLAALPAFINALMLCLAGEGTSGNYNPGDRVRCQ